MISLPIILSTVAITISLVMITLAVWRLERLRNINADLRQQLRGVLKVVDASKYDLEEEIEKNKKLRAELNKALRTIDEMESRQ